MKASLFFVTWLTLGPCVVLFTKGSRDLVTLLTQITDQWHWCSLQLQLTSHCSATLGLLLLVSVWRHWRSRYKYLLSDIGILDTSRWSATLATKGLNVIWVFLHYALNIQWSQSYMYVSDNIRFMITAAQAVDMMICGYVCVQGRSQKSCVLLFGNWLPKPESFAKN